MATRGRPRKTTQPENETDAAGETDAPPAAAEALRETIAGEREVEQTFAVEEILAQLEGNEAEVGVSRKELDGSFWTLERVALEVAMPDITDFIGRRYGGGTYRVFFWVRDATTNKWKQYATRMIRVHAAIPPGTFFQEKKAAAEGKPHQDETALSKAIDKIKSDAGAGNETLLLFLRMSQEQNNLTMKMMMDSQANMLTAMSSMFAAVRGAGAGAGNTPLDMLQMLKVFKELSGGSTNSDPIKLLEFAHKLSKEMAKEGDEEPGWLKAIIEILPRFLPGVVRPMPPAITIPAQVEAPPAASPFPAPGPFPAATANPEVTIIESPGPETPHDEMKLTQFIPVKTLAKMILPKIIEAIEQNDAEPEDAVEMFNNPMSPAQLTEKQFDDLVEALKAETWAKDIFGDESKIEKHRDWFNRLRELILLEAAKESGSSSASQSE